MTRSPAAPLRLAALGLWAALLLASPHADATSVSVPGIPAPPPPPPGPGRPNHPPRWGEGETRGITAQTGVPLRIELQARDEDLDPIAYTIAAQPRDALFTTRPGPAGTALLEWTPAVGDAGTHIVKVTATDGVSEATQVLVIRIEETWSSFFIPGVKYTAYAPAALGKWGFFHGISAEFRVFSWIRRTPSPGPAHGTVYLDLDLLASTRVNVANAFHLATGIELSFESNPTRRYLLPVYGLEVGALFQRQVLDPIGEITPTAGLYLWASPSVVVDLRAGYLLPLSAAVFDDLRGLRAKLGVELSLW